LLLYAGGKVPDTPFRAESTTNSSQTQHGSNSVVGNNDNIDESKPTPSSFGGDASYYAFVATIRRLVVYHVSCCGFY
jgi:hypothetical protein